ncbi:leucine-rich repeat-containing protein 71 isoform X7 [Strongylocentrotus purpuratus]|uniref:Leucine-rich repeat-containing protein 71 n=1 Tax=Strongylocentrotus purpuratus TaxID=7668 RepID=A0A7M7HHC6_STRPU|nr:leucine-rich repeat-containing protein 71 isoform X7 [Strongylocentrotus purpuratus]|eukprot:XP_011676714.1 PREDICTED: leucine-rich repeat-containing protein 71 isoform X6 [Strongylocentrotus purpuratus]
MTTLVKKVKMGKRVDKTQKDKGPPSSVQDNEDDANKTPEPYTCTGHFEADFTELWRRAGLQVAEMPPVVIRPKRPGTPPPPDPKSKGADPTPEDKVEDDGEEPKPKTYVTKEKFSFFKPKIQVEMEKEDKPDTVTEIFIRGWKIDEIMVGIFKQCFPAIEKLHTINLWNTSLTQKTLKELSSFLPQCQNLKNLTIEGNPIPEEPWACLIGEDSIIVNLSLRHNKISEKGAKTLGQAISNEKSCNKNLLSLNLSNNKLGEAGAIDIMNGLRMNRVLLSLSLASNELTDKAAIYAGEILSRFPLTHTEVVERRKALSDKGSPERGSGKSPPPSRRAESKDRPGSVKSGSHLDKTDKKRDKSSKRKEIVKIKEETKSSKGGHLDGKKEKEEEKPSKASRSSTHSYSDGKKDKEETQKGGTKKDDKWKKGGGRATAVTIAETMKATKGKTKGKDKKQSEAESPDILEAINPLLAEQPESIDGQLWIPGNRALINLNVSRNNIGEPGMKALLLAIQYQQTLGTLSPHPALKGLMRLSIAKNSVDGQCETYQKLHEMMVQKDPFYKPQSQSPSGDNQSTAG